VYGAGKAHNLAAEGYDAARVGNVERTVLPPAALRSPPSGTHNGEGRVTGHGGGTQTGADGLASRAGIVAVQEAGGVCIADSGAAARREGQGAHQRVDFTVMDPHQHTFECPGN